MVQAKPGFAVKTTVPRDLFVTVARRNGPLPDYHPQMLLQCLLWGEDGYYPVIKITDCLVEKLDLVKVIIVQLAQSMKYLTPEERADFEMDSMPAEAFLDSNSSTIAVSSINSVATVPILATETRHWQWQTVLAAIR